MPPSVIATVPAPDTILPSFNGPVVFRFDERISERGLEETVIVSPRTSPVEIDHGRDALRVSLREGWQTGQIYHVILRPNVSDLFGNQLTDPVSLVFSTGPPIPETETAGAVIDRVTGERAINVRVEAIRTADSLVYAVPTDTAGRFDVGRIPEGEYQIRAFEDVNVNRSLEMFEPRDSIPVSVAVGEPTEVILRLLMPDSTPPVASSASVQEEMIEIQFDDYLDSAQSFDPGQVTIVGPAGPVPVVAIAVGAPSPTADVDSAAVQAPGQPGPGVPVAGQPPVPQPTPSSAVAEPLPSRSLTVAVGSASDLEAAGDYQIALGSIRNVNGLAGDSEVTLTVEASEPNAGRRVSGPVLARYIDARRENGVEVETPAGSPFDRSRK